MYTVSRAQSAGTCQTPPWAVVLFGLPHGNLGMPECCLQDVAPGRQNLRLQALLNDAPPSEIVFKGASHSTRT